jgi:hypothetical protein
MKFPTVFSNSYGMAVALNRFPGRRLSSYQASRASFAKRPDFTEHKFNA